MWITFVGNRKLLFSVFHILPRSNERHILLQIQLFAPFLSIHSPLELLSSQHNPYYCSITQSISSMTNIRQHSKIPKPSPKKHRNLHPISNQPPCSAVSWRSRRFYLSPWSLSIEPDRTRESMIFQDVFFRNNNDTECMVFHHVYVGHTNGKSRPQKNQSMVFHDA